MVNDSHHWPPAEALLGLPGTVVWLVPHATRADVVRKTIGPTTVQITTIQALADQWVQALHPPTLAFTPTFARLLMDAVLPSFQGNDRLNYFHAIADTHGFAMQALATAVDVKQSALAFGEDPPPRMRDIKRIVQRFQSLQAKLGRLDHVDRLRLAAGKMPVVNSLIVDDSVATTPAEEQFLEQLKDHAKQVVSLAAKEFPPAGRPQGLIHAATQFVEAKPIASPTAEGLSFIDTAGPVSEARLVSRRIAALLHQGVSPTAIVIALRKVPPLGGLWGETLDEYQIPYSTNEPGTLSRVPPVVALVRAWNVPGDDFAFADVAAVLRSSFFQPQWLKDDEAPAKTEGLLRDLKEPRGKDSYLRAVDNWALQAPVPLADEDYEMHRHGKQHRLAKQLQPFVKQFFTLWDDVQTPRPASAWLTRLQSFAQVFGFEQALRDEERPVWQRFWAVLQEWADDSTRLNADKPTTASRLQQVLSAILETEPAPQAKPLHACVRILPVEEAPHACCDYLILPECTEGSWPRVIGGDSLLNRRNNTEVKEQALFRQLIETPTRELIISRSAYDSKGNDYLKPKFLLQLERCFESGTLTRQIQQMPIQGYAHGQAYSAAELRVQVARAWQAEGKPTPAGLPDTLLTHFRSARTLFVKRFQNKEFNQYDGVLTTDMAKADVAKTFGPEAVISPTALEVFSACPFKFWLQNVLRLDPLEDPPEQLEATQRGQAIHRALAALHKNNPDLHPSAVQKPLAGEFQKAIEDYQGRLQEGVAKVLWSFEKLRLDRTAQHYQDQWKKQRAPFEKKKITLLPREFETAFGKDGVEPLEITVGDVVVRIGGTIDRVDLVTLENELGYFVIDYKTGQGTKYTGPALLRFEVVQLPLYALALERTTLKGQNARPLGLAYWFVDGSGPKLVMGKFAKWVEDREQWPDFRFQLEEWVASVVSQIRRAAFPLAPLSEDCQATCPYGSTCRITQSRNTGKTYERMTASGSDSSTSEY